MSTPFIPPLTTPPQLGGWTRTMLIELADRRTERRGSKTLDLNSEFLMALQEFIMELRWSWRRKTAIFMLRGGQWQYDLTLVPPLPTSIATVSANFTDTALSVPLFANYIVSNPAVVSVGDMVQVTGVQSNVGTPGGIFNGTFPCTNIAGNVVQLQIGMTPGQSLGAVSWGGTVGSLLDTIGFYMANAPDVHQFVKHGVHVYPTPGQPNNYGELTPLFERDLQMGAIYTNSYYPKPAVPCQYFMMPGMFLVLAVTPMPISSIPITIDYWSCPNVSLDSLAEQIPLVPAFLHHVLLKKLEAQIFRYTLGEGAAKYQAAMAEYGALVAKYSGQDTFAPGEHIDYESEDDYQSAFNNAHPAVQSTT